MMHKRQSYDSKQDGEVPRQKKLRANLSDLYLSNAVSAQRVGSIMSDAKEARAEHLDDLVKIINKSSAKNLSRNLTSKLKRGSAWPKPYYFKCRFLDLKTKKTISRWIPIMLPHEVCQCLATRADSLDAFMDQTGLSSATRRHMATACAELNLNPAEKILATGLWLDGVPMNYDRSQSVDVFTLNFPGLTEKWSTLRIPLCAVTHKHVLKHHTYDDIFAVISWSYSHLFAGTHPVTRHDGSRWQSHDNSRKKPSGKPMVLKGLLAEMRGDWKMFKESFRFPQHNELQGCCWMCDVTPANFRDVGAEAAWRTNRLGHWQCLSRILRQGHAISTIFGCPGFKTTCCLPDWLHVVDQGCAADFLGCLFTHLLTKMPGQNKAAQCAQLFGEIQAFYAREKVASRLDNLTPTMICKAKSTPKLRAKGAEARALIPFANEAAIKFLDAAKPAEQAMLQAAQHLTNCYDCLSADHWNPEVMKQNSRKFALLVVALEKFNPLVWRVKPKLHLMQELVEMLCTNPSVTWCYRDEDSGGSVAQLARHTGGANTPMAIGKAVLTRFRSSYVVPRIK